MRYQDDHDAKKPRPLPMAKKQSNPRESLESGKPERDSDRHLHVSA